MESIISTETRVVTELTYDNILALDLTGKTVLIIGHPASGKTTLMETLTTYWTNHIPIRCDDYKDAGYYQALYDILASILTLEKMGYPFLIEGVQGYRLLRKGVETGKFYPDIVIELSTTLDRVEHVYTTQRGGFKSGLRGFNAIHQKILDDYLGMDNPCPPTWYTCQNHWAY